MEVYNEVVTLIIDAMINERMEDDSVVLNTTISFLANQLQDNTLLPRVVIEDGKRRISFQEEYPPV